MKKFQSAFSISDFSNAESVLKTLNSSSYSEASKALILNAIRKLPITLNADSEYKSKLDEMKKKKEEQPLQEVTEAEAHKQIAWEDVLKVRNSLKGSTTYSKYQSYVILCCYTYIPPLRLDFANMKMVNTESELEAHTNGLALDTYTFILREYKTAKKYGEKKIHIPEILKSILKPWVELQKQVKQTDWLFSTESGGKMSERTFGQKIIDLFQTSVGKPIGVSQLRHSYVSYIRKDEMPLKEQKEIASSMGHSVGMNQMYRRL